MEFDHMKTGTRRGILGLCPDCEKGWWEMDEAQAFRMAIPAATLLADKYPYLEASLKINTNGPF